MMYFSTHYLLTALTITLLTIFPFIGGTEIPQTTPVVEGLSIILLVTLFLTQKSFGFITKSTWLLVICAIATPLLYLIPIPAELWDKLPGHEIYTQIAQWINTDQPIDTINRTLSLIPYRTEHAFFFILPPLAVFLTLAALPDQQKRIIIYTVLGIAAAEACLATIQFSTNNDFFYFGIPRLKQGIALGTYPNPDHFVLLMEIAIPLTLSLIAYENQQGKQRNNDGTKSLMLFITYSILIVLFMSAAFFSGSRAGIPLTLLSAYLAYLVFMKTKGKNIIISLVVIVVLITLLASFFNLTPVINRFVSNNPFVDGRWAIFANTWEGITTFFPLGSGPGTFPDIYRIFQPNDQLGFINHAHNDFLELIFETGLIGLFFITVFSYLAITRWTKVKRMKTNKMDYLKIASGISLVVMLLHSILEFNMHDAMNILFFAVLTGTFFSKKKSDNLSSSQLEVSKSITS